MHISRSIPPGVLFVSLLSICSAATRYVVQSSTNPGTAFSVLQTNIYGLVGTTSFLDTNAGPPGQTFYRVGVQ